MTAGIATATSYYVDKNHPSASDTNPGTTEALPWKTLSKAANTAKAGDTVLVKAGIYNDNIRPANSGTSNALITFKAYPGQECKGGPGERKSNCQVVIDGTGLNDHGVYLGNKTHIRIEGFEIRNCGLSGVAGYPDGYTKGGGNWEIVNNYIHHTGGGSHWAGDPRVGDPGTDGSGFVTFGADNILIENNEFYHTADYGIEFWGFAGSNNVIVRGNNIHYTTLDGIAVGPAGNDPPDGVYENYTIEGNVLYDAFDSEQHQDAINFYHAKNVIIRNNIVYDYTQLIYFPLKDFAEQKLRNAEIYGNILYTDRYHTEYGQFMPGGDGYCKGIFIDARGSGNVVNNINIHSNTIGWITSANWGVLIVGVSGSSIDGIKLRNNIFCETGSVIDQSATNVDSDYNLYYAVPTNNITSFEGSHSLINTANPQFVDYRRHEAWDFHLQPTSPAIDRGADLSALFTLPKPFLDIDDRNRPEDGNGDGNAVFDIGAYEFFVSGPNSPSFSITATAGSGGTISPSGTTYVPSGGTQTYNMTPNTGYNIIDVMVDGNSVGNGSSYTFSNVTTNHTIAVSFAIKQQTLAVSSTTGGTVTSPGEGQFSYNYGSYISIEASAEFNYHFVNWTGTAVNAGKVDSPSNVSTKVMMDADYTVQANFAINTYTITASAGSNGKISPDGITQVNYGGSQEYNITADPGYKISDVIVDGISVGAVNSYNFTNVTANRTITASFAVDEIDVTAPTVNNLSPQADSIQVPLNTLITLDITDPGEGIDENSVTIKVNNDTVYSGNTNKYSSAYGECYRTGTKADYTFIYQSNERFNFDQTITVTVNAKDRASNSMEEYSYSFKTKMRSFGKNKKVNKNNKVYLESVESAGINNDRPATCSDSKGNIWATWHAGVTGSRDIYLGKLTTGEEYFGDSRNLTNNFNDQCIPAMTIGSDDKLYVAWQDNRRGNWDIYVSTSSDGINFSTERRVTDSNDNQINPAIVVDSSNNVYIVWEDDRNGNQDIYAAVSNNGFVTKTISQITSNSSNQVDHAIAVDSENSVYVVWMDTRNGNNDIYGAASNNGPWTNIPVVITQKSQSSPAIATESVGSVLYLVWVDNTPGNNDIYYAKTTGGLPANPLIGSSIIDDTTGADQLQPAIVVSGSTSNNLLVFVCWVDERNADYDIYFAELGSGSGTNVFVDDDGTNTGQADPAIGIDGDGYPYLVWTDNRNTNTDIYYAGSTSIESTALASGNISNSSTTTVETTDGVSVIVPAGAYPCDIKITISEVKNPPTTSKEYLSLPYDFGPSGLEFDPPVTITIPYEVLDSGYSASAYWYNLLTASPSQQGITDIETVIISSTPYLRFKTTHFTQFFVGGSSSSDGISVSGGGGGGCSMSANSQASIVELLLPYIGLTVTMVVLKLKDRRKRKALNCTKS